MAWTSVKNGALLVRSFTLAQQLQAVREEIKRQTEIWYANDVINQTATFIDQNGIEKANVINMMTIGVDLTAFFENAAVTTADRKTNLAKMLGGPTT